MKPKKVIISGVLSPASLSFNGQEIEQSTQSYEGLILNNKEVEIQETSGLKLFYVATAESTYDLKWKVSGDKTKDILRIDYPSVEEFFYKDNVIYLKFNSVTKSVLLDSENMEIKDSKLIYPIKNIKQWIADVHTLELFSSQKTSQIYNFDVKAYKNILLTRQSWIFYRGDGPFYANNGSDSFGIGYRLQDENDRSREYILSYARATDKYPVFNGNENSMTQESLEFRYRYGINPFFTNKNEIDYKRLTLGGQADLVYYKYISTYPTGMGNMNPTTDETLIYLMGGFFVRWEPIQYKNFGLVLGFDINIFRTEAEAADRENKFLGVSYDF